MKKVNFTEMKNGTKEDYQLLEKYEKNFERGTADRILKYSITCSLVLIISLNYILLLII